VLTEAEKHMPEDREGVRLFSAHAVRLAFENGIAASLNDRGIAVTIDWDPTTVIEARVKDGDIPDMVIVTDAAMMSMIESGWISAQYCKPLVHSAIGVAVKRGAPRPDISSAKKFLDTLLNSRSVAYSLSGASGIYFQKMLRSHGLLDEINLRATAIEKGLVAEKLLNGDADVAIQQISELSAVEGIEIVGPLPADIQQLISLSIAICNTATDRPSVRNLFSVLTSDEAKPIYRGNGLETRW
jgi:molybdate transport system substrate-binding protein